MANLNNDKAQEAVNTATDGVRDATNKTADAVWGVARTGSDLASEGIESATDAVNDAVNTAQQNVSTGLRQASEVVADISDKATGTIKRYPVRTVLLVAVGAAIAGLIVGVVTSRRG